jgi:hypothetical protein
LAIHGKSRNLIIAKERQPRFLAVFDLDKGTFQGIFNISKKSGEDYSDIKIQEDFLYVLERNQGQISKINLKNKQDVDRVSFGFICKNPEGKLYEPSKYGMAEALLLLEDEIWIGIDNNQLEVSDHARKTYGMEGNNPAILRFKRPIGF